MFPQRIGRCIFTTPYGFKFQAVVRNTIYHNPYREWQRWRWYHWWWWHHDTITIPLWHHYDTMKPLRLRYHWWWWQNDIFIIYFNSFKERKRLRERTDKMYMPWNWSKQRWIPGCSLEKGLWDYNKVTGTFIILPDHVDSNIFSLGSWSRKISVDGGNETSSVIIIHQCHRSHWESYPCHQHTMMVLPSPI